MGSQAPDFAKYVSAPKSVVISSIRDTPLFKVKSFLYQKYVVENLSTRQISDQIFSARSSVMKHLKRFEIPLRPEDEESNRRRSPAFGQRRTGSYTITHKRELDIINKMQKLRTEGLSYWKVADVLNALGIPTKTRKGKWSAKQVHQILVKLNNTPSPSTK